MKTKELGILLGLGIATSSFANYYSFNSSTNSPPSYSRQEERKSPEANLYFPREGILEEENWKDIILKKEKSRTI